MTLGGRTLSLDPAAAPGTAAADAHGHGPDHNYSHGHGHGHHDGPFGSLHRDDGGGRSQMGGTRDSSTRELLTESSFVWSAGRSEDDPPDTPAGWTMWGRAVTTGFSGRPETDLDTDGDVFTGLLGADVRPRPDLLAGVALARSHADMSYRLKGRKGKVDAALTSVFPYAHWTPRDDVNLWAMLGAGSGEARLRDDAGTARPAIGMRMAALGWRKALGAAGDVAWALKGDGFAVEMESEAAGWLPAMEVESQRLRLAAEGAAAWPLSGSARLRTQLELGGRWGRRPRRRGLRRRGRRERGLPGHRMGDRERGAGAVSAGAPGGRLRGAGSEPHPALRSRRRSPWGVGLDLAAVGGRRRAGWERCGEAPSKAPSEAANRLPPRAGWGCRWATASTNPGSWAWPSTGEGRKAPAATV